KSARAKGVEILLNHRLTKVVRENPASGRVTGITARSGDKEVNIRARKGVVIATGGHTSNVAFRRMFDPRLTDEYQVAGELWTKRAEDSGTKWITPMRFFPLALEPTAMSGTTERRMAEDRYGRSLTRTAPRARSGIRSRQTSIRPPGSSPPTRSPSWREKSK